jgi:uncharacterized protein
MATKQNKKSYMKIVVLLLSVIPFFAVAQQAAYEDSLAAYIQKYVKDHEVVVKVKDKKKLSFYPVSKSYRITCTFQPSNSVSWFLMEASGSIKNEYRVYGTISFTLHDTLVKLNIYQNRNLMKTTEYKGHLFIPFADGTTGFETYSGGRYIDLNISDIRENIIVIDFNKAYNPYCAYKNSYSCPLPPKENHITVAVRAGEMDFKK